MILSLSRFFLAVEFCLWYFCSLFFCYVVFRLDVSWFDYVDDFFVVCLLLFFSLSDIHMYLLWTAEFA